MEFFEDKDEVEAEIVSVITGGRGAKLRSFFGLGVSPKSLEAVKPLQRRLELIEERSGNERCLNCGSFDVKRFDGDFSQLNHFAGDTNAIPTGFMHPECGGEFLATADPIRLFYKFAPKFYSVDGGRLNRSAV